MRGRERERENIISRILIRNTSDEFENLNWFNRVKRGCSIPLVKRGEKRASVEQRARIFLGMLKGEEAQPRYSREENKTEGVNETRGTAIIPFVVVPGLSCLDASSASLRVRTTRRIVPRVLFVEFIGFHADVVHIYIYIQASDRVPLTLFRQV